MTAALDPAGAHAETGDEPSGRMIAVGVGDADADAAVLGWVAGEAVPGRDVVHVVHAYVPAGLEGCLWEPMSRRRDSVRLAASRAGAMAVQRLRLARPGLRVECSVVGGLPVDVLHEFSHLADLTVIGHAAGARVSPQLSAWMGAGPVVRVPERWRTPAAGSPVAVLVDGTDLPAAGIAFAADWARRHGAAVQVCVASSRRYDSGPPTAEWLAGQQEQLDTQLAEFFAEQPGVAVVGRIEWRPGWRERLASEVSLIVGRTLPLPGGCPVVTVPDA